MAYSRQELIDAVRWLAQRLERTPVGQDTHKYSDVPSHPTYASHFGSWHEALTAIGIPLDPRNTGYDRETLLQHLRDVAQTLGRTPRIGDLKAVDGPCGRTYRNKVGKWSTALAEAGLEPSRRGRRYGRDELLDILRPLPEELGHAPTMAELLERDKLPRPSTCRAHFGRWNNALREAGLTPCYPVNRPADANDDEARDASGKQCG